ncbi:MAG: aspartate kinase, partial [Phycisphaerales bacterium]|nr:aspartate kinase [Phycisphaerales bacterium]
GRGGSDTTAVALASAMQADICEIYTDVDGVYTTDPRIVPEARKIDAISYDEMLELASLGAGVMHSRSIELGSKYGVPIHVRSSFTDTPGTMIMSNPPGMEDVVVRGCTLKRDVGRVSFIGLPSKPGVAAAVFDELAGRSIIVDDIIQTVHNDGSRVTVALTVPTKDLGEAQAVGDLLAKRFDLPAVDVKDKLARVSIVGVGMRSHSGVAARMFQALAAANVAIENISTSEIVISVLVSQDDADRALAAVHRAFELDKTA